MRFDGLVFAKLSERVFMSKEKKKDSKKKDSLNQPDPGTTNTPDPQENMEGPISSLMQEIKEEAEENDEKDQEEGKPGNR